MASSSRGSEDDSGAIRRGVCSQRSSRASTRQAPDASSAAGDLHRVAQRFQSWLYSCSNVSLQLDDVSTHGATNARMLLEGTRQIAEQLWVVRQAHD